MIKIKKGLDIPISGSPEESISDFKKPRSVGLIGSDYNGLKPAMLVKEGDKVKIGQPLFEDKSNLGVLYTSPGGGVVESINRGERRALQSVVIELDQDEEKISFDSVQTKDFSNHTNNSIKKNLINSGLWTSFRTRPYSKIPSINSSPASIFVNCMDTNPLSMDPENIIESNLFRFIKMKITYIIPLILIALSSLTVGITGHYGASLTHVHNIEYKNNDHC